LLSVLLIIALGITFVAGNATIQAFHSWQQQEKQFKVGDVRLISYWMTVPHIARIYHVPENYLYQTLGLKKETTHGKTLAIIATEKHESVDEIIHKMQGAVEAYRRLHPVNPHKPAPTTSPHETMPALRVREQPSMVHIVLSCVINSSLSLQYMMRSGRMDE
jgi:hypothetical protein